MIYVPPNAPLAERIGFCMRFARYELALEQALTDPRQGICDASEKIEVSRALQTVSEAFLFHGRFDLAVYSAIVGKDEHLLHDIRNGKHARLKEILGKDTTNEFPRFLDHVEETYHRGLPPFHQCFRKTASHDQLKLENLASHQCYLSIVPSLEYSQIGR